METSNFRSFQNINNVIFLYNTPVSEIRCENIQASGDRMKEFTNGDRKSLAFLILLFTAQESRGDSQNLMNYPVGMRVQCSFPNFRVFFSAGTIFRLVFPVGRGVFFKKQFIGCLFINIKNNYLPIIYLL